MTDGRTVFINASTCDINYMPNNYPVVFDIDKKKIMEFEDDKNDEKIEENEEKIDETKEVVEEKGSWCSIM